METYMERAQCPLAHNSYHIGLNFANSNGVPSSSINFGIAPQKNALKHVSCL